MLHARLFAAVALTFMLSGCFNDYESELVNEVHVSLGEQLLDLKKAQDAGVISEDEFSVAKDKLLASAAMCAPGGEAHEDGEEEEEDDDSFWF